MLDNLTVLLDLYLAVRHDRACDGGGHAPHPKAAKQNGKRTCAQQDRATG